MGLHFIPRDSPLWKHPCQRSVVHQHWMYLHMQGKCQERKGEAASTAKSLKYCLYFKKMPLEGIRLKTMSSAPSNWAHEIEVHSGFIYSTLSFCVAKISILSFSNIMLATERKTKYPWNYHKQTVLFTMPYASWDLRQHALNSQASRSLSPVEYSFQVPQSHQKRTTPRFEATTGKDSRIGFDPSMFA
jgi:hypothetical protein